jgi:hypothetical protein
MEELRRIRCRFLSQRCAKTYVGYATAQLHRIRSHQKWIAQEFKAMEILTPLVTEGLICREWVAWRFFQEDVEVRKCTENGCVVASTAWLSPAVTMWR